MKWPELETYREHQKIESISKYTVVFQGLEEPEDTWKITPKYADEFKQYSIGDHWKIKVNRAGKVEPLNQITAEAP